MCNEWNKFFRISFFFLIFLIPTAQASVPAWEKIKIPGAVCGNGEEYKIFIRGGDPRKLAFGFSGGGACWSYGTCFGIFKLTSLSPVESVDLKEGIFSTDIQKSALADFTHVYFPYCTGDVFIGQHLADYRGRSVHHMGRRQVELALKFLKKRSLINFEEASSVALFGFSAGAIAALFQAPLFDPYLEPSSQKFIISDSPGLHFGSSFWSKFPAEFMTDFRAAFERNGMVLKEDEGNVAAQIPLYCQKFAHWNIGILQSSKDFIMSMIFGDISPARHQQLVFGPSGLYALTEKTGDNCSSWVPKSSKHTFLNSDSTSQYTISSKAALQFANDILLGKDDQNYRGTGLEGEAGDFEREFETHRQWWNNPEILNRKALMEY